MVVSSYWLSGSNDTGIRSGATSAPHKFCNGSCAPTTSQGPRPSSPARIPISHPQAASPAGSGPGVCWEPLGPSLGPEATEAP